MNTPLFALFARSVNIESHQLRTYLLRLLLVGCILYYLIVFHYGMVMGRVGAAGLEFFSVITYINLVFITIIGVSYFSSAITEEKEEMTLGLLRMTNLSGLSILLAKSTSRMLSGILLVLVQFPFTLLAVTLGGVSITQVLFGYAVLLAYILFLSGAGLFCSLILDRSSAASSLMGVFLFVFYAGPWIAIGIASSVIRQSAQLGTATQLHPVLVSACQWLMPVFTAITHWSPFYAAARIMKTGMTGFPPAAQVISNVTIGAFFFLLSWRWFEIFTRTEKDVAPRRGMLVTGRRFRFFGPRGAWRNALAWKDFNFFTGGRSALLVKFLVYGLILGGLFVLIRELGEPMKFVEYAKVASIIALLGVYAEMLFAAGRLLGAEVKWQTLSSIALIPVPLWKLVYRKAAGCLLCVIPMAVYGIVMLIVSLFGREPLVPDFRLKTWMILAAVISGAVFFLYLVVYASLIPRLARAVLVLALLFIGAPMAVSVLEEFDLHTPYTWMGIFIGLVVALHFMIGSRLRKVISS